MSWNPIDEPKDYITLAGQKSPGLADVVGASSIRNWDERQGIGISGAFSVFKGRGLAKFSVRLRLYSAQDWADWFTWKPLVEAVPKRRTGKGRDSGVMDILHPLLEELDIKSVAVTELMQPEQTGDGEWTVEIKFLEWRQPKVSLATPEAAAAPEPVDEWEGRVSKLASQLQSVADGGQSSGPPPLPVAP
ncbi:MAG: hypothetical protein H0X39_00475 [Actinobacteria bacterium]|nr:hypothetical protein [Actinomycetota bacterium]